MNTILKTKNINFVNIFKISLVIFVFLLNQLLYIKHRKKSVMAEREECCDTEGTSKARVGLVRPHSTHLCGSCSPRFFFLFYSPRHASSPSLSLCNSAQGFLISLSLGIMRPLISLSNLLGFIH